MRPINKPNLLKAYIHVTKQNISHHDMMTGMAPKQDAEASMHFLDEPSIDIEKDR